MKKAALLLLLLFPGCLVTSPMGANKEAGGDGDKSAVADNFLTPPPSAEPPPVDVPAAPPAAPPPSDVPAPTPIPLMRSLPGGDDAAGGDSFAGDRALAYVSPGPIDPKTDQGQAEGLPCATRHLRYGPNFEFTLLCLVRNPMSLSGDEKTLSFKYLLEKDQNDGQGPSKIWIPETEGSLVRLVYTPAGKEPWESLYIDAITDSTPVDGNVEFSDIPAAPGVISLSVLRNKFVGPSPSGWQTFADKDAFEHFLAQNFNGIEFIFVGSIQLTSPMSIPERAFRSTVLPPQAAPAERTRVQPLKSIYPSQP